MVGEREGLELQVIPKLGVSQVKVAWIGFEGDEESQR